MREMLADGARQIKDIVITSEVEGSRGNDLKGSATGFLDSTSFRSE
jgi:hypothetical protein